MGIVMTIKKVDMTEIDIEFDQNWHGNGYKDC